MNRYSILISVLFYFFCSGFVRAYDYGVVLLDTTGSMNTLRQDGTTRCSKAFSIARAAVTEFFDNQGGKKLNVFTFGRRGNLVSVTNGFTTKGSTIAALGNVLEVCNDSSTALAEAICLASHRLRGYAKKKRSTSIALALITDGKELSSDICGGTTAIPGSDFITKQWHSQVYSKIMMRAPTIEMAAKLFWPTADEIPDDFEFLKTLSIHSGSVSGSASRPGRPDWQVIPDSDSVIITPVW